MDFILSKKIKSAEFLFRSRFLRFSDHTPSPSSINLDVSWACNLNCVMCSASRRVSNTSDKILSPEKFKLILSQFPRLKEINFMGLGEPLMNPHFFELLKIAESRKIRATLITNGTLLHEDSIKKLSDNLFKVYVSLDGVSGQEFGEIRKGANFLRVIENIKRLQKLRPQTELCILTILMKETIKNLPEMVKLAKELNVKSIGLSHILSLDQGNDKRLVTLQTEKAEYYLQEAKRLARKYNIRVISRPLCPRARSCWQPWLDPLIMVDGSIHPCCFMDRSPNPVDTEWYLGTSIEVPFHQYKMGNIFTDSFAKIWNGEDFKLLRRKIKEFEKGPRALSAVELNLKRQRLNPEEKFSYCEICLWRWTSAC